MCWNWREHIHDRWSNEDQDCSKSVIGILFRCLGRRSSWSGCDSGYGCHTTSWNSTGSIWRNSLLTDEVRIFLSWRRPSYRVKMQKITVADKYVVILVGKSAELKIGVGSPKSKLRVLSDLKWVPTETAGSGRIRYLHWTNVSDKEVITNWESPLG